PTVLKTLLRAARDCGVRAIRNPLEHPLPISAVLRRPQRWKRYLQARILRRIASGIGFQQAIADAGLRTPDGTFGITQTGALDERSFEDIVSCIPDGTWEFLCHPGYCDDDLYNVKTRLRESRNIELQVLTSAAARHALERRGVELISYWDL